MTNIPWPDEPSFHPNGSDLKGNRWWNATAKWIRSTHQRDWGILGLFNGDLTIMGLKHRKNWDIIQKSWVQGQVCGCHWSMMVGWRLIIVGSLCDELTHYKKMGWYFWRSEGIFGWVWAVLRHVCSVWRVKVVVLMSLVKLEGFG